MPYLRLKYPCCVKFIFWYSLHTHPASSFTEHHLATLRKLLLWNFFINWGQHLGVPFQHLALKYTLPIFGGRQFLGGLLYLLNQSCIRQITVFRHFKFHWIIVLDSFTSSTLQLLSLLLCYYRLEHFIYGRLLHHTLLLFLLLKSGWSVRLSILILLRFIDLCGISLLK